MIVFRWIVGISMLLFGIGAVGSFAVFIAFDLNHWLERARRFRRFVWLTMLLWFNVEIWGTVFSVLRHW